MSYTLYHGCTQAGLEPIINGEYGVEKSAPIVHPWICADGDSIFFHDKELMKKAECLDDDDEETAVQYCLERCNEQAQIQNACLPYPFDSTFVLEITFLGDDFESWEDICVPDDSCPNMPSAVCMWADTFNELVKEGRVSFKVHAYSFLTKLALLYICGIAEGNRFFNCDVLSEAEQSICHELCRSSVYIDELFSPEEKDCYEILAVPVEKGA